LQKESRLYLISRNFSDAGTVENKRIVIIGAHPTVVCREILLTKAHWADYRQNEENNTLEITKNAIWFASDATG
jgi:hypothetical protein